MYASPTPTNQAIVIPTLPKSFSAMKKKKRKNMATYALPDDALLSHWSSQLMVSLAKKPPQRPNV
jgi:hypothetical protein